MAETKSGIEIALSKEAEDAPSSPTGVISLHHMMAQQRKIYRTQFSVSRSKAEDKPKPSFGDIQLRHHRVPLFGTPVQASNMLFDDVLFLLRGHEIENEKACVREELTRLDAEIQALQEDKRDLSKYELTKDKTDPIDADWDVHRLLQNEVSSSKRKALQERRGMCLTISLPKKAKEAFSSRCGMKASALQQQATHVAVIRPDNCRDGGAASTVQHVCLMRPSSGEASFFMSRDNGKSFSWGHLPDRLFRKLGQMKKDLTDIVYLTTGPMDSYFAEFRSGDCIWGMAEDDEDFHRLCQEWDVYRVAFGEVQAQVDTAGNKHFAASWIILGRDGRAAWKNLPARLHKKLESRMGNEPSLAEVALGSGDSYFVRFLDGSTDYSLPAKLAAICRSIEKQGGAITGMALHPELSHDFIFRSTLFRRDP